MQKEKPKVTYSLAFVVAFLAVENENQQPEDLPQADLAVRTKSIPENFVYCNYTL